MKRALRKRNLRLNWRVDGKSPIKETYLYEQSPAKEKSSYELQQERDARKYFDGGFGLGECMEKAL